MCISKYEEINEDPNNSGLTVHYRYVIHITCTEFVLHKYMYMMEPMLFENGGCHLHIIMYIVACGLGNLHSTIGM